MEQLRELISYLKMYRPRILSAGKEYTRLKKISVIRQDQDLANHTIYVGYLSEIIYLLRFHENCTFFLILDSSEDLPDDYHGNYCISFPADTVIENLVDECHRFFEVQNELYVCSHILLETYLSQATLHSVIAKVQHMINNPVMIIDNNYRVLCESGSETCGDVVWCENIKKGYCSYEFVTQFNQISEVRNIHTSNNAFMTGCLNSPLRRCICKLRVDNHVIGYLLAIELNSPFNELKMQFLGLASKLISHMIVSAEPETNGSSAMQITDLFSDMLSGKLKSKDVLLNCLQYSNIKLISSYYLVSVNIKNYRLDNSTPHSLEQILSKKVDYILSTCMETNIILLIESANSLANITQDFSKHLDFFLANGLTVGISDQFESLENLSIYYNQTNFIHRTVFQLNLKGKTICTYDNLRIMDIIMRKPTLDNYLNLIGHKTAITYQYDEKNGTEYFKTLYYYIRWNRNLKKTAEMLCVHRNTVSYRIQRSKELFNLDLNDFHVTMHIYSGYLIYLLKKSNLLKHEEKE